ncbi:molybdenum cofactor sulfurase 3 [Fopius arisanus]|uniref:Molybdenum cofactor sulfurase n=1 Tax=Fopius arisanus TaxID=64838 RepID=A0A9R1TZ71_9HYME|nr:PREDICTED: molybdenum cofactor sulfurase 3 [Fopius arisanus]XP_011301333.1 PREDICTED: molybdenum cofactor sulfurase 3 [Fopius arisanus]XP_011301334.1 PREDICTED: molybdenum cofactor sulfurase 3 [Fopius arisanus]XP_011301335.1 PREDICTED: molybdenum cofactor sulfurase 3 [Fopius arisanus]
MEHVLHPNYKETYDEEILLWLTKEFARTDGEFYLDHAGATLYADSQIKRISQDLASSLYANPHSAAGNFTSEIIERTRYRILDFFNASSEEYSLIFTSGTTGSLKTVAETFNFGDSGHFVYLENNHTSVLGMRDVTMKNGGRIKCLGFHEAFERFQSDESIPDVIESRSNSLFVYPAQCNFSGLKYPLEWIQETHKGTLNSLTDEQSKWYVLLDAAGFVGTSALDLSLHKPDFVAMSFYKMFGWPTGIGALIVRNSSENVMEKVYYGGGTVNMALSNTNFHVKRENLHERFEDGTVPFLSIISLQYGLDIFSRIPLTRISTHVFHLAQYLHHSLVTLHHRNSKRLAIIYADTDYQEISTQGGTVAFNILRSSGAYVGYMEILHMAGLFKIHLRTGCFCNPGACQRHLNLSNDDVLQNYDAGYKCGGSKDLIDGRPTGAVRVSFGYSSSFNDAEMLLLMLKKCFLDGPAVVKLPEGYVIPENYIYSRGNVNYKTKGGTEIEKLRVQRSPTGITQDSLINLSPGNGFNKNEMMERNEMESKKLVLSKLYIYPVKSCAAFEILDSWELTGKGLSYDREWMIVNSSGVCLTQKQEVNLCLIKPSLCLQSMLMRLDYPGIPGIELPLEYREDDITHGELCRSRICGHRVQGVDCGEEVAQWLGLALGRDLRLIRQSRTQEIRGRSRLELSFSSQAQFLLVNRASVEWLVDRIPEESDCDKNGVLHRFRGNLIVLGAEPFEEEQWTHIRVGEHVFEVMGPCTRCQMVCIDQQTGLKTIEPLRLLAEEFQGKMKFGIYLSRTNSTSGKVKIGDHVICM